MKSVLERIESKLLIGDGCWEWTGFVNPKTGYGHCRNEFGQTDLIHRVMYKLMVGSIPDGLDIGHKCNNRICGNPSHLKPMTKVENTHWSDTTAHLNSLKTHCLKGHEYNDSNTMNRRGSRFCRTCEVERTRLWRIANPEKARESELKNNERKRLRRRNYE